MRLARRVGGLLERRQGGLERLGGGTPAAEALERAARIVALRGLLPLEPVGIGAPRSVEKGAQERRVSHEPGWERTAGIDARLHGLHDLRAVRRGDEAGEAVEATVLAPLSIVADQGERGVLRAKVPQDRGPLAGCARTAPLESRDGPGHLDSDPPRLRRLDVERDRARDDERSGLPRVPLEAARLHHEPVGPGLREPDPLVEMDAEREGAAVERVPARQDTPDDPDRGEKLRHRVVGSASGRDPVPLQAPPRGGRRPRSRRSSRGRPGRGTRDRAG